MTVTLPNYLLENENSYELIHDKNFIVSKSRTLREGKLSLRNSTHILILLINGSKILHLNDDDINIDTSEILYLSQGNYFMSEIIGDKSAYESILICFNDDFVLDFIKKYKIKLDIDTLESVLCITKDKFINSCVNTINDYFSSNVHNSVDLVKLKTHEIFLYTLSKDKKRFSSFLNNIVNTKTSRIKYILESNIDIINDVNDMCKLTRLSHNVLRKEMLILYGEKPKQWLDKKRLHMASTLLKNSDKSVSQISTSCGYSSVSWFIIQFKKLYTVTPLLYREKNQQI